MKTFASLRVLVVGGGFAGMSAAVEELHLSDGTRIATLPTPRLAGADVPGGGAIMRPVLARILADATRTSGTQVHLGCAFSEVNQDAEGDEVRFDDGDGVALGDAQRDVIH
jgi:2-polyprenyl-6-methoxyphenol hydroxylase-like FAD-dependent oxidoreductase